MCTFFGSRDSCLYFRTRLKEVLSVLIEKENVKHFLVGHQGKFDFSVISLLAEMKTLYPFIIAEVVFAYLPQKTDSRLCGLDTVFPSVLENVPKRFAIDRRNRWMLEQSDIVITYAQNPVGNTAFYRDLAIKQNKRVIDLCK